MATVGTGEWGVKPPAPLPRSTLTVSLARFATTASRSPSWSRSPVARETAKLPMPNGVVAVNPPAPSPVSRLTFLLLVFTTRASRSPASVIAGASLVPAMLMVTEVSVPSALATAKVSV